MTDEKRVIDTTKPTENIVITHPSGDTTTITPDGQITYSASQEGEIASVATGDPIETTPLTLPNDAGISSMAAPNGLAFALKNGDTEMSFDEPKSYSDPNTTFTSIQPPDSSIYTAKIVSLGTLVKSNAEEFAGLAAHESWSVDIHENGEWFASIGCYIWRLNEQNTVPANRWLQAKSSDKLVVVDHDVKEADLINYLPKKVVDLLAKLNA